ncbi:MAG: hypothetical protein ACKVOQ_05825 [Cyclobacteriaceae bacterium]
MTPSEKLYTEIGSSLNGVELSQMFGKPALKINGKAFACFFKECMAFKITGEEHAKALGLKKSKLFDPSGANRPMKEWVQVTFDHKDQWPAFAKEAMAYVKKSSK